MNKNKIIYSNQEKIREIIVGYLRHMLSGLAEEAYLFGSSVNGKFGVYDKKYGSHSGSDIDVIVFLTNNTIPKGWKFLNTEKVWWKLYRAGRIEIKGTIHKVDALVVKGEMKKVARASKLFGGNILKIK